MIENTNANKTSAQIKKLSYKLQRELDSLPKKIEELESTQQELSALVSSESFYQQDADSVKQKLSELSKIDDKLSLAYARWEELEMMQAGE